MIDNKQIITKYLADTSVPADVRRGVASALNKKTIDENIAIKGITQNYGQKYHPQETHDATNAMASMLGGSPSMTQKALESEGGVNPTLPKPPEKFKQQITGTDLPNPFEKGAAESLVNSPAGQFALKHSEGLNQAVKDQFSLPDVKKIAMDLPVGGAIGRAAVEGGKSVVEGVAGMFGSLPGQAIDAAKAGYDIATGNYRKDAEGNADTNLTPEDQAMIEKSQGGVQNLNKVIGGAGQVLGAPLAVSPALQKTFSLPFEAANEAIGAALKNFGVDPETQSGKNIIESTLNGIMLAAGAKKPIMDAIKKGDLSVSDAWNTVKKTPEMVKEMSAAAIPKNAGESLMKTGERVYQAATPPTAQEAALSQAKEAGTYTGDLRTTAASAIESDVTGITKRSQGLQAAKKANQLWESKIAPELKKSKVKVNFADKFKNIQEQINKELEPGRKAELQAGLDALKDDYKSTKSVDLVSAQEIKSGLDQFTPKKVFKGDDVSNGYIQVKAMLADELRQGIYDAIPDMNIKKAYRDYANLKGLSEVGVKARTQASSQGGMGKFTGELVRAGFQPISSKLGSAIYKFGETLYNITKKGDAFEVKPMEAQRKSSIIPAESMAQESPIKPQTIKTKPKVLNISKPTIAPEQAKSSVATGVSDSQLISKLTDKQKERFNAGTKAEQARALEVLRLRQSVQKTFPSSESENPF